jgi:hypothetical protein
VPVPPKVEKKKKPSQVVENDFIVDIAQQPIVLIF